MENQPTHNETERDVPKILKITAIDRDIHHKFITDTKEEWSSELKTIRAYAVAADDDTSVIDEAMTFVNRAIVGDEFSDITSDGDAGFELKNENGDIYGQIWSNKKDDYDCVIVKV